ncbi:MAG: amino acid permease, partial [Verrucomicrobia bacterium]|nr:amino acid permease [Verrucomicrobiota bacterium]
MSAPSTTLKRELGLMSVFSIAAGAMISSGLFVLPGLAFEMAGPAMIISYALASLLMIPTLFAKIELCTAMPRSGGSYFFIERSMGPLFGTIAGLMHWLSIGFKSAFALVGIGTLCAGFFPGQEIWALKVSAALACLLLAALNAVSTHGSGKAQDLLVVGLTAILCLYAFKGMPVLEDERFIPFNPHGWTAILAVTGMAFVSYGGLTKVASVAEEIKNPTVNIPRGMFLAYGVVSLLYIVVLVATVGIVDGKALAGSLQPIGLGAGILSGSTGIMLIGLAALLAFVTTANAGLLSASRAPMAMARDGLLPEHLARTHPRFGTPLPALAVTTLLVLVVVLFLSIENLVKTASTLMLLMFVLDNVAILIMRQSRLQNYRPSYRAPLQPWLSIFAIVVYGVLILEMGRMPLLLSAATILIALFWYLGYVYPRVNRQSAFVYLVKRALSPSLEHSHLEEELGQLIVERDDIVFDRFDHLVKNCPVLEFEEAIDAKDLFRNLAETMSPHVNVSPEKLYDLFLERERESSTVIEPGLAIPHVIVPGKAVFSVALVRCKEGANFGELQAPVKIAFVLLGSTDERNFHLRALMTVAHVVRVPDFEKQWMAANGAQALRDLVLFA